MRGKRKGENDRAQSRSSCLKDLWSRRPLSMFPKSSQNKKICRRIERRTFKLDEDLLTNPDESDIHSLLVNTTKLAQTEKEN